jgi:ATP-dependent DNA helicase RecG
VRALRAARGATARKDSAPARPAESSLKSKLAKLGIRTDFDLVLHLPLRYEDETVLTPIEAARHGAPALVEGEVVASDVAFRPRRQLVVQVRDASGVLFARFLNFYQSQARALAPGGGCGSSARCGRGSSATRWSIRATGRCAAVHPRRLTPGLPDDRGSSARRCPQADRRGSGEPTSATRCPRRSAQSAISSRSRRPCCSPTSAPGGRPHGAETRTHPAWRRMKF